MDSTEREDLDALTRAAGWQRFQDYVRTEWGTDDGGGARFKLGAKTAADGLDDAAALAKFRQVMVAQREIHRLMAWVDERLAHLQKTAQSPESDAQPLSRRGGL